MKRIEERPTLTIDAETLGQRLREARSRSGLTQEAVARALELPRTAIVHIESGNRSVSTLELARFAEIYRQPIASFFGDAPAEEDAMVAVFRVSEDFEEDPEFRQELARCIAICREGAQLERLLELPLRAGPPVYELDPPKTTWAAVTQGANVAADERRRLGLGRAPVPDVAELVRDQGVWVCGAELPHEMSGLFLKHVSMGMVILVSSGHVPGRRRFSYAHEYGHALMDRDQGVTVTTSENRSDLREVRANAFAAAFLLPKSGVLHFLGTRQKGPEGSDQPIYDPSIDHQEAAPHVRSRLPAGARKITFEDVAALAHYFGVSYQAAAYRLNSLRLVSRPQLQELLEKEEFGRRYLHLLKVEDGDVQDARPDRELVSEVVHLVMEAFRREEISRGKLQELSSLLGIPAQELLRLAEEA
jgi:Zn-dependent peptidase ImmA (M78 family)/DNA-binding XRE family transcriptional regulator